jgi:hypothetical protein
MEEREIAGQSLLRTLPLLHTLFVEERAGERRFKKYY